MGTEENTTSEGAKVSERLAKVSLFERFYDCYPRRVGKGAALKAFDKAMEDQEDKEAFLMKMVLAVNAQDKYRKQASEKNRLLPERQKKFIPDWPHPATWLNQARWDDEIPSLIEEKHFEAQIEKCQCGQIATVYRDKKYCGRCWSNTFEDGPTGLSRLRAAAKLHDLGRKSGETTSEYVNRCRQTFYRIQKEAMGKITGNRTHAGKAA